MKSSVGGATMNYKLMLRMLGRTLQVEALCLLLPLLVALWYHEDPRPFLYTILPVALLGSALARIPSRDAFFSREGFTVVGLIWLALHVCSGPCPSGSPGNFRALPTVSSRSSPASPPPAAPSWQTSRPCPAASCSGGPSPPGLGGMGVLLFTLAFLPRVGGRTQVLVHAEVPGPIFSKLVPKTVQSSQILYIMYFVLTGAEDPGLSPGGPAPVRRRGHHLRLRLHRRLLRYEPEHRGLQPARLRGHRHRLHAARLAQFRPVLSRPHRSGQQVIKSDELQFFLLIVAGASLLIFWNILPLYDTAGHALRDAVFQVTSVISTSGFSTTDYNLWPPFAQTILVLLMFVGGCSGSTAGSIKCGRIYCSCAPPPAPSCVCPTPAPCAW